MPKCIVIDTSSIIFGFSHMVNIFDSIQNTMPDCTMVASIGILRELSGIGHSTKRSSPYANVGLVQVLKRCRVIKDNSSVDSWITKYSIKHNCSVCTNDIELKQKLKDKGISTYSISKNGTLR